jgi:putative transposase
MAEFDPEYAQSAFEELGRRRREGKPIPESMVERVARRLGRSRRTVLRWIGAGAVNTYRTRRRFELTREHKAAVLEAGGECTTAWNRLRTEGKLDCGLRTFQRAVQRDMTARQRSHAKGGARDSRELGLFLERQEEGRGVCFEGDHKQVDVFVLPPRSMIAVKPWITLFIDTFSRMIMGLAVTIRPTQDDVLAAFGAAVVERPDIGAAGCVPEMVRIDRGMEFTADAVTDAGVMIGTQIVHTPPYTPNRKGKVERVFRTIKQEFFATLPWFEDGQKKRSGALAMPKDVLPLTYEVFVELLLDWVWHYNMDRVHSAIRTTPVQAWLADTTPLRRPDPKKLRRHLLKKIGDRKVSKRGVHVYGRWYIAAELEELRNRIVEVRGLHHDRRSVEVFIGDEWVCTAYPHDEASAAEKERLLERRAQAARESAGLAKTAAARAKRRWKAMTAKGQVPEETTSIPKQEGARRKRGHNDELMKGLGLEGRRGKKRRSRKRGEGQ